MEALHDAIKEGKDKQVCSLIDHGADVNALNAVGMTPLMVATELGRVGIVRLLLEHGAEVNVIAHGESVHRWTALHFAADGRQLECAQALLEHGAEPGVRDEHGMTPLMLAAYSPCAPIVRALLEQGADVHAEDHEETAALHYAADFGDEETIRTLLAWGAGNQPRHLQAALGCCFMGNNNGENAHIFIEAGAKVGLKEAILMRDTSLVSHLLTVEKVDANKGSLLILAAGNSDTETVALLLAHGADPNATSDRQTALMQAYWNGYNAIPIIEALLAAGADVNLRDEHGETAFTMCEHKWHLDIMELMVRYGADVNSQNDRDETPLMKVAWRGAAAVVQYLLRQNANVHLQDNEGRTALIQAVDQGHTAIVHRLLACGADVTLRDRQGRTALSLSSRWPGKRITRLLADAGARE